jgi:O-antigen/teichoic acid export membrane protein
LLQQVAQVSGLLALLAIVTILARRLTVAELGAYGLVGSLAGYLLVFRNSVASSTVRALAAAVDPAERRLVFSAAVPLYVTAGMVTGVLIAGAGLLISGLIIGGELGSQTRLGGLGLGGVIASGITATAWLDGLRGERQFVRAARIEIVSALLYLTTMLTLVFAGAGLGALIAASGALPLYSGVLSAVVARRSGLGLRVQPSAVTRSRVMAIVPTAGWLVVVELCNLAMYAFSRVILGAYRGPTAVGLFEGPVRAHNLFYALGGALAVPVVPTASRYVATDDERRLRDLAVRGTRYTLAFFIPLCVTLMVLAGPILEVWLGNRYGKGASALTILVSYWLLYGGLVVTPGFLVGAGRAREVAQIMVVVAASNLALSLVLTPELGIEGPAVATAAPFVCAFPLLLRLGLRASGASLSELGRRAWVPNYGLGTVLAVLLLVGRHVLPMDLAVAVMGLAGGGVLAYWGTFYGLVLEPAERMLVRGLLRR